MFGIVKRVNAEIAIVLAVVMQENGLSSGQLILRLTDMFPHGQSLTSNRSQWKVFCL